MADQLIDWSGIPTRFQEVASDEYAQEVYTRDAWSAAIALGNAYVATSDRITTNLTNTHIVALVENPADSGHVVTVMRVVANIAPDAMVLGEVVLNPTTGLPTDEFTPLNLKSLAGDSSASAGRFLANSASGDMTGGTPTGTLLTNHQGRNELDLGMPLAPGTSVGVNIPLGTIQTGDGSFAVYLTQEPI